MPLRNRSAFDAVTEARLPTVLVSVEKLGAKPSLEAAASRLGVKLEDIDPGFGLVPVDPAQGIYCVQVIADRLPADFEQRQPYQGPYADPTIVPMGPVREAEKPKK